MEIYLFLSFVPGSDEMEDPDDPQPVNVDYESDNSKGSENFENVQVEDFPDDDDDDEGDIADVSPRYFDGWKEYLTPGPLPQPQHLEFPFMGEIGYHAPEDTAPIKPLDFFKLVFTDDLFQIL